MLRRRLTITGQVQGVGFRPVVYRLALEAELTGWVRNTPEGVVIEVQGTGADKYETLLTSRLPNMAPLARIVDLTAEDAPPVDNETAFEIKASTGGQGHSVLVSPDTATCADCLREIFDPADRRHLYPFTNCTNCGPRYTITKSIPYDRATTSMAVFPMCAACQAEYDNPLDRRFHAQPNACHQCGPQVWLCGADGQTLARGDDGLQRLADELAAGKICAIKGLGGFHLAALADDDVALAELRHRKDRPHKPLAVMVPDADTARRIASVSQAEDKWLSGRERPIVLLDALPDSGLSALVSPDTSLVGVMLPYTPLHHVLLHHLQSRLDLPALVMTSGNARSEPICIGNDEALERLTDIADVFLLHDRDILIRTDDSVLRVLDDGGRPMTQFLRRARGFVPSPIGLQPLDAEPPAILGTGPEMKNTLCLTKAGQGYVSQHIGDVASLQAFGFWNEIRQHLTGLLQVEPAQAIHDLHPDYMTTQWARDDSGLPARALQHHAAHAFAVAAEYQLHEPILALTLDGTGFGEDGTLWGGEALYAHPRAGEYKRLGRLAHLRLPGGEAAIREPWRIGLAALHALNLPPDGPWLPKHAAAQKVMLQMLDKDLNCPLTSSCGRLFDAAAALTGLCLETSYEGQAAIILEQAQSGGGEPAYPCPFAAGDAEPGVLDTMALLRALADDLRSGAAAGTVAARFHASLVRGLADMAAVLCRQTDVNMVALSGGVMLNRTIHLGLRRALEAQGLTPLSHLHLPPGDGCISLGQAAWGRLHAARNQQENL